MKDPTRSWLLWALSVISIYIPLLRAYCFGCTYSNSGMVTVVIELWGRGLWSRPRGVGPHEIFAALYTPNIGYTTLKHLNNQETLAVYPRISGLVVKSIVAIDGPRVRFTADASCFDKDQSSCSYFSHSVKIEVQLFFLWLCPPSSA